MLLREPRMLLREPRALLREPRRPLREKKPRCHQCRLRWALRSAVSGAAGAGSSTATAVSAVRSGSIASSASSAFTVSSVMGMESPQMEAPQKQTVLKAGRRYHAKGHPWPAQALASPREAPVPTSTRSGTSSVTTPSMISLTTEAVASTLWVGVSRTSSS